MMKMTFWSKKIVPLGNKDLALMPFRCRDQSGATAVIGEKGGEGCKRRAGQEGMTAE